MGNKINVMNLWIACRSHPFGFLSLPFLYQLFHRHTHCATTLVSGPKAVISDPLTLLCMVEVPAEPSSLTK